MIHMLVVSAMVCAPTESGTLESRHTKKPCVELHNRTHLEGQVGKKPMVAQREDHRRGDCEKKASRDQEEIEPVVPEAERHKCWQRFQLEIYC